MICPRIRRTKFRMPLTYHFAQYLMRPLRDAFIYFRVLPPHQLDLFLHAQLHRLKH